MTNARYKFLKINFDANNLKSDSHLEKKYCFMYLNESFLKIMKNNFLSHLKRFFLSQDI